MTSWCVVGGFNRPAFLFRHPKRNPIGLGEIHTLSRLVCLRCLFDVRVVEGILNS